MRLFIATTVPQSVRRELNLRIDPLKPGLPPASWVRPQTQHLSFAFLGEQDPALVDRLAALLQARLRVTARFTVHLAGCGFFPSPRRPRVGWVGLDPEQPFIDVAGSVREVIHACGLPIEKGQFHPHLSVVRIREKWPAASTERFSRALLPYRSEPFAIDTVTLYSSRLDPGGAVHTPVASFPLA